jgi:membrane protein
MSGKFLIEILRETGREWNDDKAPRMGAALAYYAVFSIAPFLIIAIGVAGLAFGKQAARGEIVGEIGSAVGQPVARAIEETLKQTASEDRSTAATVIGLVLLFFGASGVFIQIQDALNTIWKVMPKPGRAIVAIVRERFLSFTLVLATGLLLVVSVVVSIGLSALGNSLHATALPGGTYLWQGLHWFISFILITLLFALIFKIIPDVDIAWRNVWLGAAVTGVLFAIGKYLIGLYLSWTSSTSAFGAAGSLAVILLWVYYSSQIFLFGAEFTRVFALKKNSIVRPTQNATGVTAESRARQGLPQVRPGMSVRETASS